MRQQRPLTAAIMVPEMHEDPRDKATLAVMERDRHAKALGITFVEIGPGYARATMTVRADMLNSHGTCHGGAIFALADTVFAAASNSKGRAAVAQFCSIAYLRPARAGDELTAVGTETGVAGPRGVYDINVSCGDELVAAFRGHARQIGG